MSFLLHILCLQLHCGVGGTTYFPMSQNKIVNLHEESQYGQAYTADSWRGRTPFNFFLKKSQMLF